MPEESREVPRNLSQDRWLTRMSNNHTVYLGDKMKLTPPTKNVFWISVVVAAVGFAAKFGVLAFLAPYAFWLVGVAFVLLVLGNTMKGF